MQRSTVIKSRLPGILSHYDLKQPGKKYKLKYYDNSNCSVWLCYFYFKQGKEILCKLVKGACWDDNQVNMNNIETPAFNSYTDWQHNL